MMATIWDPVTKATRATGMEGAMFGAARESLWGFACVTPPSFPAGTLPIAVGCGAAGGGDPGAGALEATALGAEATGVAALGAAPAGGAAAGATAAVPGAAGYG